MKLNVKGSELKMQGFKEFLVDAYGFTDNSLSHNKVSVKTFNKTIEPCYEVGVAYFDVVEDAESIDSLIETYLDDGVVDESFNNNGFFKEAEDFTINSYIYSPEDWVTLRNWDAYNLSEEGLKETDGKTPYEELDWDYVDSMAHRMESNDKYPTENWKKEMDIRKLAASAIRHARAILEPSEHDTESQEDHAVALGCNGMMINYQLK